MTKINQKVEIVDGDFLKSKDFEEYLIENDGSVYMDQWVSLNIEGIQYDIDYTIDASAKIVIDNGSRWNPPSVEVVMQNLNFNIKAVSSNEEILEINDDEKKAFQTILKTVI